MLKTEPVASTGGAAGAFGIVVAYGVGELFPTMPLAVQGAVTLLVSGALIGAFVAVARRFSFAENTIREAGLNPAEVERRAKDPHTRRNTAGEHRLTDTKGEHGV